MSETGWIQIIWIVLSLGWFFLLRRKVGIFGAMFLGPFLGVALIALTLIGWTIWRCWG